MRDRVLIVALAGMLAFGGIAGGCSGSDDDEGQTVAAPPPTIDRSEKPPPVGDGEGGVALTEIGSFDQPVFVTQPESEPNRLYVVEQCGRIQRIPASGGDPELFLDISELVTCDGEQGLLSIAFDPGYADNGRFYVDYTDKDGLGQIVEYKRSADDVGDPQSARPLLEIEDFAPNHNGGLLLFAPDGTLLIGSGDGGGAGDPERTAQDLGRLLGKILRIDPDPKGDDPYRIPNDNPHLEDPEARGEILAHGLRNPWRFSFDRKTGDLWIGDVGQDTFEEIDAATATELTGLDSGLNFGWSAFEGSERFNEDEEAAGALPPLLEYGRDRGCSVTGGYVVRDPALRSLYGRYLYGDFCEGQLRSFTADPSEPAADDRPLGPTVAQLSSFGEDTAGRIYAISLDGPVYRLDAERN